MKTRAILALTALAGTAGMAIAQPATQIRFSNGTNEITVAAGAAVPVSIYAVGMPNVGTSIPWTTPPGTGQAGQYNGFLSVLMDMQASGGSWSGPTIPGGMGYQVPPFGNPGTPSGSNVTGINIGVGFNPPVTGNEFILWSGTITVGAADVNLSTLIKATGNPPQTGFEVALGGIIPGLNVSHFVQTANGTGVIHVPAPASLALLGLGGLVAGRRRRA